MFYSTLQALCEKKGVKITNVVADLKISTGNLSKWKAGVIPKSATITKIADYFGVSADYLLGRTDKEMRPCPKTRPPRSCRAVHEKRLPRPCEGSHLRAGRWFLLRFKPWKTFNPAQK